MINPALKFKDIWDENEKTKMEIYSILINMLLTLGGYFIYIHPKKAYIQ